MSKTLGSLTVGAKIEVPVLSAYQSRFGSKIVFKIEMCIRDSIYANETSYAEQQRQAARQFRQIAREVMA